MKAQCRVEFYRFLLTQDLEGNVESPNVGTEPARICKLGHREKMTTSIKTWDNISPTHWKKTPTQNAKPDYVKALSSMSKNSSVCVSILRLFNINWCYLAPHVSTEGMSSWVHRTCTLTWKNKQLFLAIFSEKRSEGRGNAISFATFKSFPRSSMCHNQANKQKEFIGTNWGKVGLKPCRHLSFWNLLPLCTTNTPNVQDFALYDAHLETSQWYFSVKPWGEWPSWGAAWVWISLLKSRRLRVDEK